MASGSNRSGENSQVLVVEKGSTRILILNRPKQLNALSFQMISQLLTHFIAYEENPDVKLVILKGNGRAFCAGGDVAAVAKSIDQGHWSIGARFFWNEFTLNYILATYSKPQVSLLYGFVMGGGAGVSIHGKFRVATENTVFAMPETGLGLFPDIGASYFLSRLQGFLGEYVGLTGVRLDGSEMLACGLATHFVSSKDFSLLEKALVEADTSDLAVISDILDRFSQNVPLKEKSAFRRLDIIDKCFCKGTVEEIIDALEQEVGIHSDEWIKSAIKLVKSASPSSLKISLRSIREGRTQGIDQCLAREYRMCCHVLRRDVSKDFFEGCRALLVDKDKNPKWEPAKLEQMTDEMVSQYFTKVDDVNWEDLRLSWRQIPATPGISRL